MEISPHSDSEGMECPDKSEPMPSASGISWNMEDSVGILNEKGEQEKKFFQGRHFIAEREMLSRNGGAVQSVSHPSRAFSVPHLKCRFGFHESVSPEEVNGRICKIVRLHKSIDTSRILKERAAARATFKIGSMDPDILLKALLKGAIKGIRILDGRDSKTVYENRQALEKLRRCGFKSEFRLLQMLHNAKLESQSKNNSDDITQMFEKIRL